MGVFKGSRGPFKGTRGPLKAPGGLLEVRGGLLEVPGSILEVPRAPFLESRPCYTPETNSKAISQKNPKKDKKIKKKPFKSL